MCSIKLFSIIRSCPSNHSLLSGCLTKTTMIYTGIHQINSEFVFRVTTFRNITFLSPMNSFLYPMLVETVSGMKNCSPAYTLIDEEFTLRMKGQSLLAIDCFFSSSACKLRSQSSWLTRDILVSLVTALFRINLTIFCLDTESQSIFLQKRVGISTLQAILMVWTTVSSLRLISPTNVADCLTSLGQEHTMILRVLPGFSTVLIAVLPLFSPSLTRKNPAWLDLAESSMLRKQTSLASRGRTASPYCPGRMAPRLSIEGTLRVDLLYMLIQTYKQIPHYQQQIPEP